MNSHQNFKQLCFSVESALRRESLNPRMYRFGIEIRQVFLPDWRVSNGSYSRRNHPPKDLHTMFMIIRK
jgi:hypothetical protein